MMNCYYEHFVIRFFNFAVCAMWPYVVMNVLNATLVLKLKGAQCEFLTFILVIEFRYF